MSTIMSEYTDAIMASEITMDSIELDRKWRLSSPLDKFMRVMSDAEYLDAQDYAELARILSIIYPLP